MSTTPIALAFASVGEAMDMARAALGYLAAADATQLAAETQAECLRTLELPDATSTAVPGVPGHEGCRRRYGERAMKITQAYRFALDPSPAQERMLWSHAGAARFAWNWGLAKCQERYEAEGKWWHVSFTVQVERAVPDRHARPGSAVGVDLGIKALLTGVDDKGQVVTAIGPKAFRASLRRLRRASRAHSRKQPGSANRRKHAAQLARIHARVAYVRADALHKATTSLAARYETVVAEDLNVDETGG